MSDMFDFTDQVVTITGAGSGFGKLAAENFAAAGAKLALSDINLSAVEKVAAELNAAGGDVIVSRCDVGRNEDVESFFGQVVARWGRFDVCINNAGMAHPLVRLADCTEEMFDTNVAVNLKGVFLCMKQELPVMMARGKGVIVNIASVAGLIGSPFMSAYSAAKHGVVGLTRTAAVEYGRKGIRINAVCPAFSHTGLLDELVQQKGEKVLENFASFIPMQRLARPQEVVDTILWLSSGKSTFTNGAAIPVDGGLTAG